MNRDKEELVGDKRRSTIFPSLEKFKLGLNNHIMVAQWCACVFDVGKGIETINQLGQFL